MCNTGYYTSFEDLLKSLRVFDEPLGLSAALSYLSPPICLVSEKNFGLYRVTCH